MIQIIPHSWSWHRPIANDALESIAKAARTCTRNRTDRPAEATVRHCVKRGHLSVIEHETASVKITTDRAVLAQLTRHRLASYSVESQRYVDGRTEIRFCLPAWASSACLGEWDPSWHPSSAMRLEGLPLPERAMVATCLDAAETYRSLRAQGLKPEDARGCLPNWTATEMIVTANLREWRHIFAMRCDQAAQAEIRGLMKSIQTEMIKTLPEVFL